MRLYLTISLIIFLFTSCNDRATDVNIQQELKNDTTAKESHILFETPQVIDSTHIIMYPLIFRKTGYNNSYTSSSRSESTSYWNLIFYNAETGQQHLLTDDKKILISTISFSPPASSSYSGNAYENGINILKNKIFYTVLSKDYNADKQLNFDDPNYLYVSDKEGNNFRQISPDDYNIISWDVLKGTTKIIMQGQKDENNDKKFDNDDRLVPLIADLASMQAGKPTFDSTYINAVQQKLSRIWKPESK